MHTRRLFFIYDNWKILRMVWILTPVAMHGYDPSRKKNTLYFQMEGEPVLDTEPDLCTTFGTHT
jgi:hypothetical protein